MLGHWTNGASITGHQQPEATRTLSLCCSPTAQNDKMHHYLLLSDFPQRGLCVCVHVCVLTFLLRTTLSTQKAGLNTKDH